LDALSAAFGSLAGSLPVFNVPHGGCKNEPDFDYVVGRKADISMKVANFFTGQSARGSPVILLQFGI
jgi:hypothetical protein